MNAMRFEFATAGRILFGPDITAELPAIVSRFGQKVFILTGSQSQRHRHVLEALSSSATVFQVTGEPTTRTASDGIALARWVQADVVVGIGGGSVIDTGKVVAAMLTNRGDLKDYLEVVGAGKPLQQVPVPYVAIPTTAGTGAEVTRNAVLLVPEHKVKVSMRSGLLLPKLALVNPRLTHSVPPDVTAATGLDALTQLAEAFVCKKANPLTDGICREGLTRAGRALRRAFEDGNDAEAREDMAIASLFSGLALANAGLGAVHGFAGPLGGMINAPHGAICGKLLPFVTEANVRALRDREAGSSAPARFDEIARILTGSDKATASDAVQWIHELCGVFGLPGLRQYGLREDDFPAAVAKAQKASSMKGNPVELHDEELAAILAAAID